MAGQAIYNVDIVMCIDATGSMAPIIDEVKSNAISFYQKYIEEMEVNDMDVAQLRIKVIAFRDYACDDEPMTESQFFTLPDQNEEFRVFLNNIEAKGGGDFPENAFEAIATALKSDWVTEGPRRRHIIVVFTDAPALPLGERAGCANYPVDMPKDFVELSAWWEGTSQDFPGSYSAKAGRLIAFVPNDETWTQLEYWSRFNPVYTAGKGCNDFDMLTILDWIVGAC